MIAASLCHHVGLIAHTAAMRQMHERRSLVRAERLLAPAGYVMQDAVADAMTVEAVPRVDDGQAVPEARARRMHTTMQTLGRVAMIGGPVLVADQHLSLRRRRTSARRSPRSTPASTAGARHPG